MSSVIEQTVKALVEFESELDRAKAEVSEAKRKAVKDASDWAASARSSALSKAQARASEEIARAREEAESESEKIRKKGAADLAEFESSISKRESKAAELVRARLLGESK
jgi:vacuolar-type H+-ATPase subunit H